MKGLRDFEEFGAGLEKEKVLLKERLERMRMNVCEF